MYVSSEVSEQFMCIPANRIDKNETNIKMKQTELIRTQVVVVEHVCFVGSFGTVHVYTCKQMFILNENLFIVKSKYVNKLVKK